ncbi:hypothetical protein ACO02O_09053 [Dirofilaria immitis]
MGGVRDEERRIGESTSRDSPVELSSSGKTTPASRFAEFHATPLIPFRFSASSSLFTRETEKGAVCPPATPPSPT